MSKDAFLSRWSRRKRTQPSDTPAGMAPSEAAAPPDGPVVTEAEASSMSDADILARLGLPDPTTLAADADFRAFLRAGVPRRLQRLALRRLWRVTPAQAALDGLVDYADDYTDAAMAVKDLATTYQVGRGLGAHIDALARAQARRADGGNAAAPEEPVHPGEASASQQDEAPAHEIPESTGQNISDFDIAAQHDDNTSEMLHKPRKMTFRFNDS
jgi:hypothetical protein